MKHQRKEWEAREPELTKEEFERREAAYLGWMAFVLITVVGSIFYAAIKL